MARPVVSDLAERFYEAFQYLTAQETAYPEPNDYPLLKYLASMAEFFSDIYDLASDSEDGTRPGWADVLDVDRCPNDWLPWLSQLTGTELDLRPDLTYTGYGNILTINQSNTETDTSGLAAIANATIARVTTQKYEGTASLQITATAAADADAGMAATTADRRAVIPGQNYIASVYARPNTTARNVRVVIQWYDINNAVVSTAVGTDYVEQAGTWTRAWVSAVAPANAVSARMFSRIVSAGAGEIHFTDARMIEPAPAGLEPSLWVVGGTESVSAYWGRQRERVRQHLNWNRGSANGMREAAGLWLTGSKTVLFRERDTSPYHITVNTRTSETPDAAKVLEEILKHKPAGIILVHQLIGLYDYIYLNTNYASYTALNAAFANYNLISGA